MAKFYNDKTAILDNDMYFTLLESRGIKYIKLRRSKDFGSLSGREFEIGEEHIWSAGDSFWKLANKHMSDPSLWWVLAIINKKPTDNHCAIGDVIYIPKEAYLIAEAMR
jgi:hypothetical protein